MILHTGWLGHHEEEKAYQAVIAHQLPQNPVFASEPPTAAAFRHGIENTPDHLLEQGIEDGWEFWTAQQAFYPQLARGPQDVGDCVGYSDVLSFVDGICDEVYWLDEVEAPFIPLVWFSYGAGRVYIGQNRLGRSHGSTGAWQIAADVEYGYLPHDAPGLRVKPTERPEPWASEYEPWSWTRSILDQWAPKAAPYKVGAHRRLQTAQDVMEAVTVRHRPLTIASNQGFRKRGFDSRYGITLWDFGGSWAHQMHIRAVVKIKGNWFVYVGNQWGADFHGDPGRGPRGGFWIAMDSTMEKWAPRAVIYERGKFVGRPPEKPEFSVI